MNEILDEIKPQKRNRILQEVKKYALITIVVVWLAYWIGTMIFGKDRSAEILIELQNTEEVLKSEVSGLKNKNALLQKQYFELLGLEPDK